MTIKEAEFKRLLFRAGFACGNSHLTVAEIKEREWQKFLYASEWEQEQILFHLLKMYRENVGKQ